MNSTTLQLAEWIIAGLIAAWFFHSLINKWPMGLAAHYTAAVLGAVLGGLIATGLTGGAFLQTASQNLPPDQWWLTVPAAFAAAAFLNLVLLGLSRARRSP